MKVFQKFIIPIVVFTLPFLLYFNFLAYANNQDSKTVDLNFFRYYLSCYPKEDIDELNSLIGEVRNYGFHVVPIYVIDEYDWSGNVFSDLQQVGEMVKNFFEFFGSFFKVLWEYIAWFFRVLYTIMYLVWDTISWVLSLPREVVRFVS